MERSRSILAEMAAVSIVQETLININTMVFFRSGRINFVAFLAQTIIPARRIGTNLAASIFFTFINIQAGFLIQVQSIPIFAEADVVPFFISADLRTISVVFQTLINVHTSFFVSVEFEAFRTRAGLIFFVAEVTAASCGTTFFQLTLGPIDQFIIFWTNATSIDAFVGAVNVQTRVPISAAFAIFFEDVVFPTGASHFEVSIGAEVGTSTIA